MEDSKKSKELVINLDTFGVPIAIIVAALIIAGMIYFVSKGNDGADNKLANDPTVQGENESKDLPGTEVSLGDDPYLGNLDTAKVAIIEFSDYNCGYCQRHNQETYPSIVKNYVDTGKVVYVFKEFPLSPAGQIGYTIAEGGACVFDLKGSEAFAQYHKDAFFKESKGDLITLAKGLGIDEGEFSTCLDSGKFKDEIGADLKEGQGAGISGTPGFVVGLIGDNGVVKGKLISGAYPYDTFVSAIEELLK